MTVRQLSLATSWRGSAADLGRTILTCFAAAFVTFITCGAVSASLMADRVNDRAVRRSFEVAAPGEAPALLQDFRYDGVDGDQVFIFRVRFLQSDVRIEGVPGQPETGSWFVSPRLAAAIELSDAVAERYPNAQTIAPEGVGAADELFAYQFVASDTPLRQRLANRSGNEYIGLNSELSGSSVLLIGLALVLVISLTLLRAAIGPVGAGLNRRLELIEALGASPRWRLRLVAVNVLVGCGPGIFAVVACWVPLSSRLEPRTVGRARCDVR